jgi:hypothetical protein
MENNEKNNGSNDTSGRMTAAGCAPQGKRRRRRWVSPTSLEKQNAPEAARLRTREYHSALNAMHRSRRKRKRNRSIPAIQAALPGSAFTVNRAAPPKDSALTAASAELKLSPAWSTTVKFEGEFGAGAQTAQGRFGQLFPPPGRCDRIATRHEKSSKCLRSGGPNALWQLRDCR